MVLLILQIIYNHNNNKFKNKIINKLKIKKSSRINKIFKIIIIKKKKQ